MASRRAGPLALAASHRGGPGRVTGHAGEILIDQAPQLRRGEVADHDQRRVSGRGVVGVEERLHVGELAASRSAIDPMTVCAIREAARGCRTAGQASRTPRLRLIFHAQAALFLHGLSLIFRNSPP